MKVTLYVNCQQKFESGKAPKSSSCFYKKYEREKDQKMHISPPNNSPNVFEKHPQVLQQITHCPQLNQGSSRFRSQSIKKFFITDECWPKCQ